MDTACEATPFVVLCMALQGHCSFLARPSQYICNGASIFCEPGSRQHHCCDLWLQAKNPEDMMEGGPQAESDEEGDEQTDGKGEEGTEEEGCGKEVEYEFTRWEERVLEVGCLPPSAHLPKPSHLSPLTTSHFKIFTRKFVNLMSASCMTGTEAASLKDS